MICLKAKTHPSGTEFVIKTNGIGTYYVFSSYLSHVKTSSYKKQVAKPAFFIYNINTAFK